MGFEIFNGSYPFCVDNFYTCFIKAGNSSPPGWMVCRNTLIDKYIL